MEARQLGEGAWGHAPPEMFRICGALRFWCNLRGRWSLLYFDTNVRVRDDINVRARDVIFGY